MCRNWSLSQFNRSFCVLFLVVVMYVCDTHEQAFDTYTISSFSYASTRLSTYEWRYIRVDLPEWFSSLSLALESDVDLDLNKFNNVPTDSLAIICFRDGSLPLPDIYNTSVMGLEMNYISNASFVEIQSLQNVEKCYPMQKTIQLRLTNEQISPGTWYFGIFNGIGPVRTQSKMIDRGSKFSFSCNITVEGCRTSMMLGQFCNQTVNMLSCKASYNLTGIGMDNGLYRREEKNVIACRNANGIVCHEDGGPRIYSLDVLGIVEELLIAVANVTFSQNQVPSVTRNYSLICYARHGAMPLNTVYDFSSDLSRSPLVIRFPEAGRWFVTVQSVDLSATSEGPQSNLLRPCYLLEWQVLQCPVDKAGLNCTLGRYMLQAILRKNPTIPFESNYVPTTGNALSASTNFHLEPLLSNLSRGESGNDSWTFFLLEIPFGATGGNIHIHLTSETRINYEIYARYGGLPSLTSYDYYYINRTSSSSSSSSSNNNNGSMFFKLYDSSEERISFYILYARVGTWCFGVRQLNATVLTSKTDMSLSIERCPEKCSSHGSTCRSVLDASGLTLYSYCACDRDHGGFDCSIEIVTHRGHIRQSIFLIASNAAALLPAYWALRSKAFAEWVLFTCSGISSAVYHACDVGSGCLLTYRVLQFFDFWLSFMAVVSTFVYLTTVSEVSKRTIHTIVALLTALIAEIGPTRSRNIGYVMGLGAAALFIGWLIEFWTCNRSFSFLRESRLDLVHRWHVIRQWIPNIIKTIIRRFRWGFIAAGIVMLTMAAVSWIMETTETYWIWHSLWHLFIYTSSFFFLCSKPRAGSFETTATVPVPNGSYELTRQASFNENEVTRQP